MPLEDINNPRVRIQDLILEEPLEGKFIFNPDKDITEEDFQKIGDQLRLLKSRTEGEDLDKWIRFANLGAAFKILFPDSEYELNLDEDTYGKIIKDLDLTYGIMPELDSTKMAFSTAILFPQRDLANLPFISPEGLARDVTNEFVIDSWIDFTLDAILLKFIYPPAAVRQYWSGIKKEFDSIKLKGEYKGETYRMLALATKILFPDQFNQLRLEKDREFWEYSKRQLNFLRRGDFPSDIYEFAEIAMHLKLLAADSVSIDPAGLKSSHAKRCHKLFYSISSSLTCKKEVLKMVLESLSKQGINIKDLVIDEPIPVKSGVDFTNSVTPDNLVRIEDAIARLKSDNSRDFLRAAFSLRVIFPKEADNFEADENLLKDDELESWAYLKLYSPGTYRVLSRKKAAFLKEAGENLYRHLRSLNAFADRPWPPRDDGPIGIPKNLVVARILYPVNAFQDMIDFFVPGMVNTLNPDPPLYWESVEYLESWFRRARMLKILAPKSIDIKNLKKDNLDHLKDRVLSLQGSEFWGNLIKFTNMAADMTIVAAEDVQVTNEGLVLIQKKELDPFVQSIPKIPVKRSF